MKFTEFEYKRPEFEVFKADFEKLLVDFETADSAEKQNEIMKAFNNLRRTFDTMSTLCSIRYDVNTEDKFYEADRNILIRQVLYFRNLL